MNNTYLRGEVYYADLNPVIGSEQGGCRPVVIIQNNTGNRYSPTVIVAAITSHIKTKAKLPTHVVLTESSMLKKGSMVMLEQIRTIDKNRLKKRCFELDEAEMKKIDSAIAISFSLNIS